MHTDQHEPSSGPPSAFPAWRWSLFAMAFAAIDLSFHLFRNWVAFDEGALGLASHLVLQGKWPHADFSDVYSGGLAVLGAGAQLVFGDTLVALRIPLAVATVLWVGLLAACFRRFTSAPAAAGLALVGYLWGPPLYTAAIPSWYLLFLATLLCWTLFRWNETEDPRWLAAAGATIGLALAFKINALFLLAAAGCVLLTDERHRGGVIAAALALLGVAGAVLTIGSGWPWSFAALLLAPLVAVAVAAVAHARRARGGAPAEPARLVRPLAWLTAGLLVVVLPWVAAYALHGGLRELAEGLFVLPFKRSHWAGMLPPPFRWQDLATIALLPLLLSVRWGARWTVPVALALVALTLLAIDAATLWPTPVVRGVWRTVRGWAFLVPILVAVARWHHPGPELRPVMIAGWIAAWFALLQYPFAAPNYLAYVGGTLLLAGVGVAQLRPQWPVGAALAASLGLWSLGVDHGQSLAELGFTRQVPQPQLAPLTVPHGGGLLIPASNAAIMEGVVQVLDRWGARTIVAGPDAPELYYFSDRPLPDRELFEFVAPDWSAAELARRIARHDPDAVVLNAWAPFSGVDLDSVRALLPRRPLADTTIGPFHMLLFRTRDTAPAR